MTCTVANTGQVTFYKVPEKHGPICLVTRYEKICSLPFEPATIDIPTMGTSLKSHNGAYITGETGEADNFHPFLLQFRYLLLTKRNVDEILINLIRNVKKLPTYLISMDESRRHSYL